MQTKYLFLLVLVWLCIPLQVTDATASRMSKQDVYQLLKSGDSEVVQSLALGEREIFLATMAMNQGSTAQALAFLNREVVKKNQLAALIKAEAYRRQSVEAADRAGHYAHAVNDDIGALKRARITDGLDKANTRLNAFMERVSGAKPSALQAVVHKPAVVKEVAVAPVKVASLVQPRAAVTPQSTETHATAEPKASQKTKVEPAASPAVVVESKESAQADVYQSVSAAIEIWREDWESRDSKAYLRHYHKSFKTLKHDYNSWVAYKRRVNGSKSFIKVTLSDIKIIPSADKGQDGEAVLVVFNQRYQSNNFNAESHKQLYMARKNSSEPWLILYEGDGA
ncbi:MAG: hypothetical protein Q9M17_10430 [Mariprofundus sp.]|nr:hypothetical protein [Mariprofundus sp.]